MQASTSTWTAPSGVLGRILAESRERVRAMSRAARDELERHADRPAPAGAGFAAALRAGTAVAVIAGGERRPPAKGGVNAALSAAAGGGGRARAGAGRRSAPAAD